jgi:hypothetical protein
MSFKVKVHGRWTKSDHKSSPCHFVHFSREIVKNNTGFLLILVMKIVKNLVFYQNWEGNLSLTKVFNQYLQGAKTCFYPYWQGKFSPTNL